MGISESVSGSKRTDKSMKLMLYCVLLSFAAICRESSVRTKAICRLHVHHTGSLLQNKGAIAHASVHSVHIASKIDITLLLCYSQKNNRTERKGCDGAMTLEQLAFISEVEAAGTIVAAARNLYVSHTTVSRAISSLEDELGFAIFDRSRRGSTLTDKGAKAIRLARIILENAESLKQLGESRETGALHIGAYPIGPTTFLQDVVSRFNHVYPEYTIFLNHAGVNDIIAGVRDLTLDFGLICCLPELWSSVRASVQVTELFESNLVIICSPDSPLSKKPFVTPNDLLILPSIEFSMFIASNGAI